MVPKKGPEPAKAVAAEKVPVLGISLFGHARFALDGAPFPMATPRKTLQLLAYLLLHRDAAVGRDYLSFLLYPDDDEESARTKSRASLYDLQRVLPPAPAGHWISLDGNYVRWNPAARVRLDVDDFERALADPRRLEEATSLYEGDLLASLYDEWLVAPRERFRGAFLAALARLIAEARRKLDYPRAIGYAKRLLEVEPLREDIARRLIALRYEAGDRAGALDEYARFERRVRDELGVDPMPETVALRDAVLRDDPIDGDAEPQVELRYRERAVPQNLLPFVGRREEIEVLLGAWSAAARNSGGVIFVGGDAGIGKSRLIAEFAREVEERGGRVLVGATGSPETTPYQAIVEALRSALPLVAALPLEEVWLAVLATLLPELSSRLGRLPVPPRIDPEHERARLFGALQRTLTALARARPVLLLLEDLHWAGEATIAALSFLGARLALAPILVVATYRGDEAGLRHPLRRARRDTNVAGSGRTLSLAPLSIADFEEILNTAAPLQPQSPSASALHAASAGNPLLLAQLLENPDSVPSAGHSTLAAVVAKRLALLTSEARTVAEIAALVGTRFSREVVHDAGGWGESAFRTALDQLLDLRIVSETTGRGDFDYAFVHESLREAVAAGAPAKRSRDRHHRIARALEELHAERAREFAAEVARHYELAGEAEPAARWYLAAARRALSLTALSEADAHVERALGLGADTRLRADLLIERDRICRRSGDQRGRASALEELESLAHDMADDEFRREVAFLRVEFAAATVEASGSESALGDALARLRGVLVDAGPRWQGLLALEEARAAYVRADLESAEGYALTALDASKEAGDDALAAKALIRLTHIALDRGRVEAARGLLAQARNSASRAADEAVGLEAVRAEFLLAYNMADHGATAAAAQSWLERGVALGDRNAEAYGSMRLGVALLAARRNVPRIREALSHAISIFEELESQRGVAAVLLNRGVFNAEICNFASAASDLEAALRGFDAVKDDRGKAIALFNLAEIYAVMGEPGRGREVGEAGLALARDAGQRVMEALALENLAFVSASAGDLQRAISIGSEALTLHRETESPQWTGRLLGDLAEWSARIGDLRQARRYVEEMLASGASVSAEWPQRFHWSAAQVLRACGERDLAARELECAHKLVAGLAGELEGDDLTRYESATWNRAIGAAFEFDEWPGFVNGRRK